MAEEEVKESNVWAAPASENKPSKIYAYWAMALIIYAGIKIIYLIYSLFSSFAVDTLTGKRNFTGLVSPNLALYSMIIAIGIFYAAIGLGKLEKDKFAKISFISSIVAVILTTIYYGLTHLIQGESAFYILYGIYYVFFPLIYSLPALFLAIGFFKKKRWILVGLLCFLILWINLSYYLATGASIFSIGKLW